MLQVESLKKVFSAIVAVDGVSFEANSGEILGLLGPNGAGKTTTIRMLLDIIRPDRGEVLFDGKPFTSDIQNVIGYLPEERGLYRKSKVLPTIQYFASLHGLDRKTAESKGNEWLDRLSIATYRSMRIEELSKGNQQKIQFIISILHNPRFVILDEPFYGLDPMNQLLLKEILRELKQQGKVIILSTHMMDEAEKLCGRICLIDKGRVVLKGSMEDIKKMSGSNAIHVEFEGNGNFLGSAPYARHPLLYENYAEFELENGIGASEAIRDIAMHVQVRKFEVREPSLYSIFLEKVGYRSKDTAETEPAKHVVEAAL